MESLFLYLQLRLPVAENVGHRLAENEVARELCLKAWQVVVWPVCWKKTWIVVFNVQHPTRSHSSARFLRLHQLPGSLKDWTCCKLHRCRAESEPNQSVSDQRHAEMKQLLPKSVALPEGMIFVIGYDMSWWFCIHLVSTCTRTPL